MYACCHCGASIHWFNAFVSSYTVPYRCGACATEQHRADFSRFMWAIPAYIALVLGLVVLEASGHRAVAGIVAAVSLCAWAAYELDRWKQGRMLATARKTKLAWRGIAVGLGIAALAFIAADIFIR